MNHIVWYTLEVINFLIRESYAFSGRVNKSAECVPSPQVYALSAPRGMEWYEITLAVTSISRR